VFPEGITEGPDGDFFVGSTADGTLFRIVADRQEAEVWSAGGADSRTELLGLHLDSRRRLVACGGSTGRLFVIDVDTRALVASRSVPAATALLNDVVTDPQAAYITDSARPVVWRLPLDEDGRGAVGQPEVLVDLQAVGAGPDSFLNGIVIDRDLGVLLVVAQGSGVLWRVDLDSRAASRVDLGGASFGADGMLLRRAADGARVLAGVTNAGETRETLTFSVDLVQLHDGLRRGELVAQVPLPAERYDVPTTIAAAGDRLLVVCGQVLHPENPRPPFVVRAVDLPGRG
jgi:sugar lactone lactonase YvrE